MPELHPAWCLAAALAMAVVALLFAWWRATTRVRRGNLSRLAVARRGEVDAERLLRDAGYRVVDRQVPGSMVMVVDGEEVDVGCRLDLLVEDRRGGRYAAEVKTGSRATEPTRPATRRQLLEYERAFDVEGLLLVDMDRRRVRTVEFR